MADSINNNAVDGMGRSYANIDMDMLKSLMSGKVGEAKPFDTKGTDEIKDEIKKLAKLLGSKNADFVKDLQKAVKYIDEMKKVLSSVNKTISSNKEKSNFNDMANALGKVLSPLVKNGGGADAVNKAISASSSEIRVGFKSIEKVSNHLASLFGEFIKMMEPFVDEGLKKGSIFTRDERLSQKIGKGLKIEKGSIAKWSNVIFAKSGGLTKGFRNAFSDIKPEYQEKISEAIKSAASYAQNTGMSEAAALGKAFTEAAAGMGEKDKKQFLKSKQGMIERIQLLEKEDKILEKGAIKNAFVKVGDGLARLAASAVDADISFSGITKEIGEMAKGQADYKQAMFETSGIVRSNFEMQNEIEQLAKTNLETGYDGTKATKEAAKYARNGLKLNKDTTKVIKTQLSTERQLGLEAGTLNDHFKSLTMEAGFSSGQVEQMGRDMSNVAKASGLSGQAMKDVLEKSKELAKVLQSSGTLTVDANKNILHFMAEAKKLGVEEGAAEFGKTISSLKEFTKSQNHFLQQAVGNAGEFNQVINGTLLGDKKALSKVAEQYQKNISAQLGPEIKTYADFQKSFNKARLKGDQAEMDRLSRARMQVEQATGTSLENALKVPEALIKGVGEASKPLAEKIAKITEEQKKGLIDEDTMKKQITKLESDSATSLLTKVRDMAAASDNVADFNDMLKTQGGQELEDIAGKGATATEALQKSLEKINKRITQTGGTALKFDQATLAKAVSGGKAGDEGMAEIQESVMKASREADEREMRANNPAYQAAQTLNDVKESIVKGANSVIGRLNAIMLEIAAVAAAIGGLALLFKGWDIGKSVLEKMGNKSFAPAPAPPPNTGPSAPAPPPDLDGKGKTIKGAPAPAPPPDLDGKGKTVKGATAPAPKLGETKGAEAVEAKGKKKISAEAVAAKSFKDAPPPTGRKSMWQKTKSFGSGVKGKIGGLFSGGAALAGGLAETAVGALGGGGGGDEGGCACSIAESALSKVGSLAGVATDAAAATAEAALDAGKKTAKNVTNVADDAAKGAAKATAKGVANTADDAVKVAGKSAGLMSKATGALGKTVGFLGKAAGPLAGVASVGLAIGSGENVGEAISGGVGAAIGGSIGGALGSVVPVFGTIVGGVVGGIAGDWLGNMTYEYLPAVWEGAKNVGSNIASSIGAAGSWAGDKISGAASWAGDKISGAASAVGDAASWAGDKISGAASGIKNAASAVGSGISSAASSVGSGISSAASSVGSGISSAASSVGSAASAGWSNFTGWLGFSEGAREIENNGLAMLHKGEVIFPRSIVETLVAKGTSSFGSLGGYLKDMGGGLASAASSFVESGGVGGLLGSAVTQISSSLSNTVGSIFGSPSKMSGEMATAEMQTGANKASSLSTAGNAALSSIANASESQANLSSEIKGVLKEILGEMIKSNRGEGGGDESAYSGMSSNRDAFKSPIGNINDVAVKNVSQVAYG
jgi:hypothetical protein